MNLDPAQKEAVEATHANKVVVAGPGSGKTRTLTGCVEYLLATGVPAGAIAVLTFTNAAAHELNDRIGINIALGYCGTLHAFCYRLINLFGITLGYKGRVAILPPRHRKTQLEQVMKDLGCKLSMQAVTDRREGTELVWKEYEFRLRSNNLVDFDSVLREGKRLLEQWKDLDKAIGFGFGFRFLLVEEAQDSAPIDWDIYDLFPAERKMFVGDPDQCIFAFRGADPAAFVTLTERLDHKVFTLETNYRSDVSICRAATNLIRHNDVRFNKAVVPVTKVEGEIHVDEYADPFEEDQALFSRSMRWLKEGASVAVLLRRNHEVDQVSAFLRANAPTGYDFIARHDDVRLPQDWDRTLTLMALTINDHNDILAERLLRMDYGRLVDRWKLEDQANERSLWQRVSKLTRPSPGESILGMLARAHVSDDSIAIVRQRIELLPPESDLAALVHDLYAHEGWVQPANKRPNENAIFVSTIHGAKGMEFDVVFLPAFEDEIIPGGPGEFDNPHCAEMEEERRLAFVALTRARHQVYISSCEVRPQRWGPPLQSKPSRFIKEMQTDIQQLEAAKHGYGG